MNEDTLGSGWEPAKKPRCKNRRCNGECFKVLVARERMKPPKYEWECGRCHKAFPLEGQPRKSDRQSGRKHRGRYRGGR